MTINVSPWFVERPGLASLDLLSDFKDFLVEIGELTAQDSIYDLTVDWGEYHIDGVDVYEGNGIPDVAEIALFYHILKSVHLNETNNGDFVIPAHAGIQWV